MKKRTIIGLAIIAAAVATMFAAPTAASAHDKPQYTTVLWHIPDDSKGPNDQDQPYVISIPGADIQGIKQYAECGKRYQIDVYRPLPSGTKPDTLWANGFLRPNHDGGFLAYDLPYTPYEVFTTKPCPVVTPPPVVTPDPPPPVVTPTPVPPVSNPEVPSSPVTPNPETPGNTTTPSATLTDGPETSVKPPKSQTVSPSLVPTVAPSQRTAQTCQQAGPNVKTTDRNLDGDGDGIGCETRGVAPVPTPIRTEAKFTG